MYSLNIYIVHCMNLFIESNNRKHIYMLNNHSIVTEKACKKDDTPSVKSSIWYHKYC